MVALVGATATGKTEVAELLAGESAEVVCADSRQVFRELEIGTGKPAAAERALLPHHLFDALHLARGAAGPRASAGWYARALEPVLDTIASRGRTPILVGGSGLYLRAAMQGLAPVPSVAAEVRARLAAELAASGSAQLHRRLAAADPAGAAKLHPHDAQRITRALEILESTGRNQAWWHRQPAAETRSRTWIVVELTTDPATLRGRIEERTRRMFEAGLVEETRALLEAGLGGALSALRAVRYDEAMAFLSGRLDRAGAEERTRLRTAQLAKRQRTWFRHQVDAIRIETGDHAPAHLARAIRARLDELTGRGGATTFSSRIL